MKLRKTTLGITMVLATCALAACGAPAEPQATAGMPLTSATRLRIAEAAEAGGDLNLAASLYGAVDPAAGASAAVQLKVADGQARNGRIDGAEQTLQQALLANPGQPDLLRALGMVHLVLGKPETAITEFDQALATRPGDTRSMVDKAIALDLIRRHAEAQPLYRQALALSPNDADIRTNLAISLMLEGRVQEASVEVAALGDGRQSSDRVKNNIGVIYAVSGDIGAARRMAGRGLSEATLSELTQALPRPPAPPVEEP